MSLRDNKLLILRELNNQSLPISLPDLLEKLNGLKERSVRRWLDELIREGRVQKVGQKRATKYFVISKISEIKSEINSCFGSASLKAIDLIKKPLYERNPVSYQEEWLNDYQPNVSFYLSSEFRTKLHIAGQRAKDHDPAGTYARKIYTRLLIDLSYNSSRLEGCTYSLLDTERLILHGDSANGKLDEEKIMILNHKEAIRYLVDNASKLEITYESICTLHYLLSDGLLESNEVGKIRQHGVRVGGSAYVPLENHKKLKMLLEKIAKRAALIQDSFEQSFFLLVHVSYLQAFADVNKRTARLASNIALIKENLVPLSFNDIKIDDYRSAKIAVYELQNILPLADIYMYSYLRTCAAYDVTVQTVGFDEIRIRYRQQRRTLVREILLGKQIGEKMKQHITAYANNNVPAPYRDSFIEDIFEDLRDIDGNRLAGLGVTLEELEQWQRINLRNQ